MGEFDGLGENYTQTESGLFLPNVSDEVLCADAGIESTLWDQGRSGGIFDGVLRLRLDVEGVGYRGLIIDNVGDLQHLASVAGLREDGLMWSYLEAKDTNAYLNRENRGICGVSFNLLTVSDAQRLGIERVN